MRFDKRAAALAMALSPSAFAGGCSDPGAHLLALPVRVTTETLQPVEGLQANNFVLKESKAPLAICGVSHAIQPVSVGILLDVSGSMRGSYDAGPPMMRAAVNALLDSSRPEDEYFLEYVNDVAHMQCLFSCDRQHIRDGLQVKPKGQTALIDGIYLALHGMSKAHHANRALLLISDGEENASLYRLKELNNGFSQEPVLMFMVSPPSPWFSPALARWHEIPRVHETAGDFTSLVTRSGGYSLAVHGPGDAVATIAKMALVIRAPYTLLFAIPAGRDPKSPRGLRVEVTGMHPKPQLYYGIIHDPATGAAAPLR